LLVDTIEDAIPAMENLPKRRPPPAALIPGTDERKSFEQVDCLKDAREKFVGGDRVLRGERVDDSLEAILAAP
jgi:hypothetical protein